MRFSEGNPKSRAQSATSSTGVSASTKSKKSPQKSSKAAAEKVPAKQPRSNKEEKVVKKNVSKTEIPAQKITKELHAQEDSDLSSSSDGAVSDREDVSPGRSTNVNRKADEPMEVEQNDVTTKTASGLSASTDSEDDSSLD